MKLNGTSRILTLGLSGALTLFAYGCSATSASNSVQAASSSSSEQSTTPTNSTTVGSASSASSGYVFAADGLGFSYTLPQGYNVVSENTNSDLANNALLLEANDGKTGRVLVELLSAGADGNAFTGDYLDAELSNTAQSAQNEGYEVSDSQKVGLTIGNGTTIPSVSLTLTKGGEALYLRKAYVLSQNNVIAVSAYSSNKSDLNEILQGISQSS